jgi:hypothetical protein
LRRCVGSSSFGFFLLTGHVLLRGRRLRVLVQF